MEDGERFREARGGGGKEGWACRDERGRCWVKGAKCEFYFSSRQFRGRQHEKVIKRCVSADWPGGKGKTQDAKSRGRSCVK